LSFDKVLIANRGEVALRVIRACRERGLRTVAVYSEADAQALHVRFADEAVCIGPAPVVASYLNMAAIISAAEISGAQAIHPGYGFLSENADFADLCQRCGLIFIGPSAGIMAMMGDKVRARQAMERAGVPVLPGSGVLSSEKEARATAERIGYPLIIKASAGGGGRGMKVVNEPAQLIPAWVAARTEAQAGFGCPDVYIERFVGRPRHIEVQVMADQHGNVVHLGERECSIQRRHQKLIEEAPSAALSQAHREKLGKIATSASESIGYDSVGTLEFLMDERDNCYFMEMNTRLQVEHTVTEEVTDVDIVDTQLAVAAGSGCRSTNPRSVYRHIRLNVGSTPRIRSALRPLRVELPPCTYPQVAGYASTRRPIRATRYRPTTTHCWRS
jgi:acetyl-CoA carboxylase biotin carboxylase subunit